MWGLWEGEARVWVSYLWLPMTRPSLFLSSWKKRCLNSCTIWVWIGVTPPVVPRMLTLLGWERLQRGCTKGKPICACMCLHVQPCTNILVPGLSPYIVYSRGGVGVPIQSAFRICGKLPSLFLWGPPWEFIYQAQIEAFLRDFFQ